MTAADRHGEAVVLVCADSDAAIRALLAAIPEARDIEIAGPGSRRRSSSSPATRRRHGRLERQDDRMRSLAYTRFELLRTFRNGRFFVFSLGFPLVLYFLIAAPNRNEHDFDGIGISRRCTSWSEWRRSGR